MEDQLAFWNPESIIYSKIDRSHRCARRQLLRPGRPQRRCGGRGRRHFGSGRARAWARCPSGRWYGWFPPAVSRAHPGGTGTLLSVSPPRSTSAPGFSACSPLSSAQACARGSDRLGLARPESPRRGGHTGSRGRGARGLVMGRDALTLPGPSTPRPSLVCR